MYAVNSACTHNEYWCSVFIILSLLLVWICYAVATNLHNEYCIPIEADIFAFPSSQSAICGHGKCCLAASTALRLYHSRCMYNSMCVQCLWARGGGLRGTPMLGSMGWPPSIGTPLSPPLPGCRPCTHTNKPLAHSCTYKRMQVQCTVQ